MQVGAEYVVLPKSLSYEKVGDLAWGLWFERCTDAVCVVMLCCVLTLKHVHVQTLPSPTLGSMPYPCTNLAPYIRAACRPAPRRSSRGSGRP